MFQFVLHLGVATGSTGIILEQTGKDLGYRDKDVRGFCPESHCCVEGGPEKLDSLINMRTVCKELNQPGVDVHYSRDAGRYRGHLCCVQRRWRRCKNRVCVCSSSGICVILLTTAHSITVGGRRPWSTSPRPAAWPQLTGWSLCCRTSSGPCWPSWRTFCSM